MSSGRKMIAFSPATISFYYYYPTTPPSQKRGAIGEVKLPRTVRTVNNIEREREERKRGWRGWRTGKGRRAALNP
jgi:hypothetical protein